MKKKEKVMLEEEKVCLFIIESLLFYYRYFRKREIQIVSKVSSYHQLLMIKIMLIITVQ